MATPAAVNPSGKLAPSLLLGFINITYSGEKEAAFCSLLKRGRSQAAEA